jgi:hypothetical protein
MKKGSHKIVDIERFKQQEIYNKYIIQFSKIEKLHSWIHDYHNLITSFFKYNKLDYDLIKKLNISFSKKRKSL